MKIPCLASMVLLGVFGCAQNQDRTVATLPAHEVLGASSMCLSLYYKTRGNAATAIGQIFLPPKGYELLVNTAFFFLRNPSHPAEGPDMSVRLRISKWNGNTPASGAAWESPPKIIKSDFQRGWIDFSVPHIRLDAGQKYVAWLSFAGLENPDDASLCVVTMGATTLGTARQPDQEWQPNEWKFDYLGGERALWKRPNPSGVIDEMTRSDWETEGSGENLYFKMVFENKKN